MRFDQSVGPLSTFISMHRFHDADRAGLIHETLYSLYCKKISATLGERGRGRARSTTRGRIPGNGFAHKYGTRRCFPNKFPFSLVYVERETEVYVIAIAPDRRKPGYWKARRNDG